ncbi:MAG: hypothetical protein ACRD8W_24620 [Nitrososphaeraceae archaeon]
MIIGLPISGISLVIAWLYMIRFGSKVTDIASIVKEKSLIVEKILQLGNITRDEKVVAAIFISTAVAWITRGLLWKDLAPAIDDSTIVLIAAISLFLFRQTHHCVKSKRMIIIKFT